MYRNGNVYVWNSEDIDEDSYFHKSVKYNGTGSENGVINLSYYLLDKLIDGDYRIIRIDGEYFTAIENVDKKELYFKEDYFREYEVNKDGVSKKAMEQIMEILHYEDYMFDCCYYGYEDAILRVREVDYYQKFLKDCKDNGIELNED